MFGNVACGVCLELEADCRCEQALTTSLETSQKRFGKILVTHDYKEVIEVLPFVFIDKADLDLTNPSLFFDRFANLTEPQGNNQVELTESIFLKALWLLRENIPASKVGPDLDVFDGSVGFAALIATAVHLEQRDKLGFPYIEHPRRVYLNSKWALNEPNFSDQLRIFGYQAAWLHDVLEDSADNFYRPITPQDLSNWGFTKRVISIVEKLTRLPEHRANGSHSYYEGIRLDAIAREVKLADIADNLSTWRVELLPEAKRQQLASKYRNASEELALTTDETDSWFTRRVNNLVANVFALPESELQLKRLTVQALISHLEPAQQPRQGIEGRLSSIMRQAAELLNSQPWQLVRDPYDLPMGYSLEVWFSAYISLLLKAASGDSFARSEAESLAKLLDARTISQAEFHLTPIGFLPENIVSGDIQLVFGDAVKLLRASHNFYQSAHASGEHPVGGPPHEAPFLVLLLAGVIVLDEASSPLWSRSFMKEVVIAILERFDDEEIELEGHQPSSRNPLFVVDPPLDLATADTAELREWASQMIAKFKEQSNRSEDSE
jgi:hypothetical protein